ncbi:acylneuraminate cytidylyltransferase family protein [Dyadobacter flavalbus]|uniref:Acylneuraminate cytidylyltransferase family protein n=1 Tax=Dyadobacter flavalbus TaxID=2579942 RepID=A0A5M8R2K2_9BACT|nr:acylneuraminate cytidylyltransferase family protein [Dyadobacter flavalbus]KAA6440973.1 acylneuraminate cytidylyltransferase family protein [Dyadobacter flavalbus]
MNGFPEILGIIPARKGSKGIPGKNLKLLGGKPLIQYTIESALECKWLNTIVVSSDCEHILRISGQFKGIEAPFIRPAEFADDSAPAILVLSHAVKYYQEQGKKFDYVCLLQPTAPFRSKNLISEAIIRVMQTKADSLVTISKIPDKYNPNWAFQMSNDEQIFRIMKKEILVPCRQQLADTFYRNGKVYIIRTELIQNGILLGGKIIGLVTEPGINIDTQSDWENAENYIRNGAIT